MNFLKKKCAFLKTLYIEINGIDYELSNIIFYNEKGKICETKHGYFEENQIFTFKGENKRKIKESFSEKCNFVLLDKTSVFDKRYILYIHENNVESLQNIGLKKQYGFIYNVFKINDLFEINEFIRDLSSPRYTYVKNIEEEAKKIQSYCLPVNEKELTKILNNIKKYNKKLIELEEHVKTYEPTTLEEEIKQKELLKGV